MELLFTVERTVSEICARVVGSVAVVPIVEEGFTAAQYRRDAVGAHVVANALIAWAVLVGDRWSLWS